MNSAITSFSGDNAFLSNFYHSVIFGRLTTVEHWFQACKAVDGAEKNYVLDAPTPGAAKRRGRRIKMRADWDEIKLGIMQQLLREKFSDPELAKKLIATGSTELVEGNTWGDRYWGVYNGEGENHLGKLLMAVRDELVTGPSPTEQ